MKLIKIKELRKGQIRLHENKLYYYKDLDSDWADEPLYFYVNIYDLDGNFIEQYNIAPNDYYYEKDEIVGFIDVSYEIKDNKLLKIERETDNYEEDDVVLYSHPLQMSVILKSLEGGQKYNILLESIKGNKMWTNLIVDKNDIKCKVGELETNFKFISHRQENNRLLNNEGENDGESN